MYNIYLNGRKVARWAAYMIVIFSAQASVVQAS